MPSLAQTIQEMLKRGMGEEEIKENLRELGVDDADAVYSSAVKQVQFSQVASEPLATPSVSRLEQEVFSGMPAVDAEKLERKVDDLAARVRSLEEVMQKILDANRQILLRLRPASEPDESERGQ